MTFEMSKIQFRSTQHMENKENLNLREKEPDLNTEMAQIYIFLSKE